MQSIHGIRYHVPYSHKNIRKLGKFGGKSISVTLPIDIIHELSWKSKQKVVVQRRGDTVVIKDWEG